MARYYINFRQSAIHPSATDDANQTYWHFAGGEVFPAATRAPFIDGFGQSSVADNQFSVAGDRSGTGIVPELAGVVANSGKPANTIFAVTLPEGVGYYRVGAGFGDRLAARSGMSAVLLDDETTLHVVSGMDSGAADSFVDLNGSVHTAANWRANETRVDVTFSGTVATFIFGVTTFLTHLSFEKLGGGGGSSAGAGLVSSPLVNSRLLRGLVR